MTKYTEYRLKAAMLEQLLDNLALDHVKVFSVDTRYGKIIIDKESGVKVIKK